LWNSQQQTNQLILEHTIERNGGWLSSLLLSMHLTTNWDDVCPNMVSRHGYRMSTNYDFWILQQEMKNVKTLVTSINLSTCISENDKVVTKVDVVPKMANYYTSSKGWSRGLTG